MCRRSYAARCMDGFRAIMRKTANSDCTVLSDLYKKSGKIN